MLTIELEFPTGQVPQLEMLKDGKTYQLSQSLTIARALARKHGLTGDDEQEAALCDEVVDCINELTNLAVLAFMEQDSERKEKIKNRLQKEEYPRILGFLERKLQGNGGKHMVGKNVSFLSFSQ